MKCHPVASFRSAPLRSDSLHFATATLFIQLPRFTQCFLYYPEKKQRAFSTLSFCFPRNTLSVSRAAPLFLFLFLSFLFLATLFLFSLSVSSIPYLVINTLDPTPTMEYNSSISVFFKATHPSVQPTPSSINSSPPAQIP